MIAVRFLWYTALVCVATVVCGCANNDLRSQLHESQSRVEELETQVEELQSRVDTLESGISDIRASFDTLSDEIDSLKSKSSRFDFHDWSYVVGDVRRAISRIRTASDDLDSAISAVE